MNKQQAIEKLAELEQKAAELKAIIDKPEVKPLFPRSWKEGAEQLVSASGEIAYAKGYVDTHIAELAARGRTFYTREEAEAFAKRERTRAYCLERINEVNEGDNGFNLDSSKFYLTFNHNALTLTWCDTNILQASENLEYIRTQKSAKQLINDPEFIEHWKIWKGAEV